MERRLQTIHPLLFALFPAVYIYILNRHELALMRNSLPSLWALLGGLALATVLLQALTGRVLRSPGKGAMATSLALGAFYLYTDAYRLSGGLLSHDLFVPLVLIAVCMGWFLLWRTQKDLGRLNGLLTFMAATPFVLTGAQLLSSAPVQNQGSGRAEVKSVSVERRPDVYFIVLDAHAAPETLAEHYALPNATAWMKERGFRVVPETATNYSQTTLSLPATLNMTHHPDVSHLPYKEAVAGFLDSYFDSKVLRQFKALGYETVSITSMHFMDGIQTDRQFHCHRREFPFLDLYADRTMLTVVKRYVPLNAWIGSERESLDCSLKALFDIPKWTERPKFVYAHLLAPHRPFLFDRQGSPIFVDITEDQVRYETQRLKNYKGYYRDQLLYTHDRLRAIVDEILARSSESPVIILQSDHGPNYGSGWDTGTWDAPNLSTLREKMLVLNAVLAPAEIQAKLYPRMTLGNTFPIVLNGLFGTDYERIEDKSFYSSITAPNIQFRRVDLFAEKDPGPA